MDQSNKLDLSDKLKNLSDQQRKYVEYNLSGTKLSDFDLINIFGENGLDNLRSDLPLRRFISELKMEKATRKHLIDDFKTKEMVKIIPLAIKTLVDIMQNGKEHNKLSAAQFVARPAMSYLEKQGMNYADLEVTEASDGKFNFVLNVERLASKAD